MTKVLITGASSGIGEAFARVLHQEGHDVYLVARREERLKTICDELNLVRNGSAQWRSLDLSTKDGVASCVDYFSSVSPEILINNVGRGSFGYFDEISVEEESDMVALNVVAPLQLTHHAISHYKKKGIKGDIIIVSSIAAFQPLPFLSTYAATKAFNFQHALGLRAEVKQFGINIMAVLPGPTATEFGGVARVPGTVTGIARDTAEMVARESVTALKKKRAYVITGCRSWWLAFLSRICPVGISTYLMARSLRSIVTSAPDRSQ